MRKLIFMMLVLISVANAKCEFEDCSNFVRNIANQFIGEFENAIFGDFKKLQELQNLLKKFDEVSNSELEVLQKLQKLAEQENLLSKQTAATNTKLIALQSTANKLKVKKAEVLQKQAELLLLIKKLEIEDVGGNLK